jgi:D-alanyl-D-alanine dipeptidase
MSEPQSWSGAITFRCGLVVDGVPVSAYRQVDPTLLAEHPEVRDRVEQELRFAVAREIVDKVAPEVTQARPDGLEYEQRLTRDEVLRLARAHAQALAKLATQLEEAGENYALTDAWRARDAAQELVDRLAGDDGRLPTDPRFWASRRH